MKETSKVLQLQVLVLFHIDDSMLAGRKGEAGWEELQRSMHNKWTCSEWERGHFRMTGSRRLTVSGRQLRDGSEGSRGPH